MNMKTFVTLLVVIAVVGVFAEDKLVWDRELVNHVNNLNTTWVAGFNPRFEGKTHSHVKALLTANIQPLPAKIMYTGPTNDLPTEFDSRTKWPGCVGPVLDQGQCGSCWAFGAAEALSDRFCIATGKKDNVVLSPQDLVSCDWEGNSGCNGGIPHLAWDYMEVKGIRTLDCVPYTSGSGERGSCRHSCVNSTASDTHYKVKLFSTSGFSGVSAIGDAIMKHGPIEATFQVYEDFQSYVSGVYQYTTGGYLGGHAIEIIGWGVDKDSGLDYWIVKNSWSTTWGMDGYFWIKKGSNECSIESGGCAGLPHT